MQINYNEDLVQKVQEEMVPTKYISKLSSFFKAIGDDNRSRIIYALSVHELCVNDLSVALDISQSLVSHQLKLLKMTGLVTSRREGKNIYYSLDDQHVVQILDEALKHIEHRVDEGRL